MDDDKPTQLTEEEIKAANDAETKKWEGDFKEEDLKIPYKREESNEEPEPDEELEDPQEYSEPEPVVTVQDPGEYIPKDYSFDVELEGKKHSINTPEEAEKFMEDNADKFTAAQILTVIKKSQKMENNLERDKEKWETDKATFEEQTATENQRQETINNFASEFEYLVGKGLLPEVSKALKDADWNDPEVAKQPGVKDHLKILNYLVKENAVRAKSGVKPITSIVDAYNAWKLDLTTKETETARKEAGEARRAASARIAGVSSAPSSPLIPKGIAVGNPRAFDKSAAIWDN